MKIFILLRYLITGAAAVKHSLQYFYTASSGKTNFPEFVTVGLVDGQQISYYDSNIRKEIPKQDWMEKNEGPDYWEGQTQVSIGAEQMFKANIQIVRQRFNQTGGVHIFQWMFGCEWDDDTGEVKGYDQFGYDGEDFIALDLKSESWTAARQQAQVTKTRLDSDRAMTEYYKNYFNQDCPEWLKKYLNYGRSALTRTVLPSVSLLQKSPSSPVSCHATGFYPNRAEMFWRKDGEEIHEGVEKGEILPNNDGTFQMSADLSSVPDEDLMKYECVFKLSGANEDLVTSWEELKIMPNEGISMMIISIIVALVVLAVIVVIAFVLYKKKNASHAAPPVEYNDVQEQMLPTPQTQLMNVCTE